jgi:hypothetical protein
MRWDKSEMVKKFRGLFQAPAETEGNEKPAEWTVARLRFELSTPPPPPSEEPA